MIGIVGEDGEGYRWLPPRASDVRDGRLRVIPYASRRAAARLVLFNALVTLAVFACRHDERHGIHVPWHATLYQVAVAVLLVQLVLRVPGWLARRQVRVRLPLRLQPVPVLYWVELVQFFSALTGALVACIASDHPHPLLPWEILSWAVSMACVAVALAPWIGRQLLRRRGAT